MVDHRVNVAAQKRARMRLALLAAGLLVMSEKGVARASIDDVVRQADVARGSFYKHFETTAELADAIAVALVEEIVAGFEDEMARIEDPADRLAAGVRAVLRMVADFPVLGHFIARTGWPMSATMDGIMVKIMETVDAGAAAGRFASVPSQVAKALVGGVILGCIHETALDPQRDLKTAAAAAILRGLGMGDHEAEQIAGKTLPPINLLKGPLLTDLFARHGQDKGPA